jgi:hypothetical protein
MRCRGLSRAPIDSDAGSPRCACCSRSSCSISTRPTRGRPAPGSRPSPPGDREQRPTSTSAALRPERVLRALFIPNLAGIKQRPYIFGITGPATPAINAYRMASRGATVWQHPNGVWVGIVDARVTPSETTNRPGRSSSLLRIGHWREVPTAGSCMGSRDVDVRALLAGQRSALASSHARNMRHASSVDSLATVVRYFRSMQ